MTTQRLTKEHPARTSEYPQRIVCLTSETAEIVHAVGAGDRVVGVSAFATRPAEVKNAKRVSAFTTADVAAIMQLEPDLILTFSDLQREIARDLIHAGATVLATNQRSLADTYATIRLVARAVGREHEGDEVAAQLESEVASARTQAARLQSRPRVYFEEWDEPVITGIRWVSELIEAAGGEDIYPEMREKKTASERIVSPDDVASRDPEVIFASWCGKPFRPQQLKERRGWANVSAVREGRVHEIPGADILAPGPSLVQGLRFMSHHIAAAAMAP